MGYIKVDTNTQLSDADITAMGYIKVDTQVTVNDTLTSTSTTQALSAKQGKILQDAKVDNSRVLTDVPINALFTDTDTVYIKPASEPISYIDGLQTAFADINHEHTLGDITGVALSTPSQDQVLAWNGVTWTNSVATYGGSGGAIGSTLDGGSALSTYGENAEGGSGQGITVYANATELAAATLVVGALAYVQDSKEAYICTGLSWAVFSLTNEAPTVTSITSAIDDVFGTNPATGTFWNAGYLGYSDIVVVAVDPDGTVPEISILSSDLSITTTVAEPTYGIFRLTATADDIGKTIVIRVSDGDNYSDHSVSVTMREAPFVAPVAGQQLFITGDNFTVPANVYSISAVVIGGGGHGGYTVFGVSTGAPGQRGGIAIGTIPVTPNENLMISVGGAGNGSTISRSGVVLLQATGAVGSSLGTPQDFAVNPSSGNSYAPYESYLQHGGAGLNTLTMVGSYGSYLEGQAMDPNPTYSGGRGGSSYHQGLNTWMDSHNGWDGGPGIVRIIWGYTDSTNVTVRSFPSTGIGNY
jgi:hypothetical protein